MNDDLISRKALKDALNEIFDTVEVLTFDDITAIIDDAPTVDERPKGKWELYQYQESRKKDWYCTACATIVKNPLEKKYSYCPYCGADMRSVDEGLHERAISDLSKAVDDAYKKARGDV